MRKRQKKKVRLFKINQNLDAKTPEEESPFVQNKSEFGELIV